MHAHRHHARLQQRAATRARPGDAHPVLAMQRLAGNQAVALAVQRAKIDFQKLQWSDFKGPKPAAFPAETASDLRDLPKLVLSKEVSEPGAPCAVGSKKSTEFTATVGVDAKKTFKGVTAYMDQGKSGADPDYKKNLTKLTASTVKECTTEMTKKTNELNASIDSQCADEAQSCKQAFADGSTSYDISIGDKTVSAKKPEDCGKALPKQCRAALVATSDPGSFEYKHEFGGSATAKSLGECKSTFSDAVKEIHRTEADRLLHHEQVHFNITNAAATDVRTKLEQEAAQFAVTATACGKKLALAQASKDFKAADAREALTKVLDDAKTALQTKQDEYDDDTDHGKTQEAQDTWSATFPFK